MSKSEYKRLAVQIPSVDHDKIIPADERTDSEAYSMALLCKQDKQQLNRIEAMLKKLLNEKV